MKPFVLWSAVAVVAAFVPPASAAAPRYFVVLQPSSVIYYDFCGQCWTPGPASVEYYPVGATNAPRPAPALFIPPARRSALPPPERPPGATEAPRPEEADRVFWVGYRSYWQGDHDRALASFDGAIRLDAQDARFWYYKALAERALGDTAKAEASAQRGRELHAAHKPKANRVSAALERVQGQERRFLNAPEIVVSDVKDER